MRGFLEMAVREPGWIPLIFTDIGADSEKSFFILTSVLKLAMIKNRMHSVFYHASEIPGNKGEIGKKVGVCMRRQVYSLLVDNNSGVLSRIAGLFSRRGYSIDSITAGMTADPRFTRITIVSSGDELILSQIEKQVRKLEDVREIKLLNDEESVYRELIMVKVRANAEQRAEVISVTDIFRAKIVDVEKESLTIELTGDQSKLEAFLKLLDGYEILELARTGITGLSRGSKNITYL